MVFAVLHRSYIPLIKMTYIVSVIYNISSDIKMNHFFRNNCFQKAVSSERNSKGEKDQNVLGFN